MRHFTTLGARNKKDNIIYFLFLFGNYVMQMGLVEEK